LLFSGERISSLDIRLGMPHERNFKVQAKRRRASIGGVSNVVAHLIIAAHPAVMPFVSLKLIRNFLSPVI
jgi:hypothetical protein